MTVFFFALIVTTESFVLIVTTERGLKQADFPYIGSGDGFRCCVSGHSPSCRH
jgi:hypothetical protein